MTGHDRASHLPYGFKCSVPAAVLLRAGDGRRAFLWTSWVAITPSAACSQLSQRVFCCLSSVCLLITDSLLWESMFFSSWPSCCHLALALGETCCRKAKGGGQGKQLSRGPLVGGTALQGQFSSEDSREHFLCPRRAPRASWQGSWVQGLRGNILLLKRVELDTLIFILWCQGCICAPVCFLTQNLMKFSLPTPM